VNNHVRPVLIDACPPVYGPSDADRDHSTQTAMDRQHPPETSEMGWPDLDAKAPEKPIPRRGDVLWVKPSLAQIRQQVGYLFTMRHVCSPLRARVRASSAFLW